MTTTYQSQPPRATGPETVAAESPPSAPVPPAVAPRLAFWTLFYALLGALGQSFTLAPHDISLFSPASGLAVAVVMVLGSRLLPAVFLGALLLHGWLLWDAQLPAAVVASAVALALIATLQAAAGAFLVRRWVGLPLTLLDLRSIATFVLLAGALSGTISAVAKPLILSLAGLLQNPDIGAHIVAGWFAEVTGVAICAPLILAWITPADHTWQIRRMPSTLPVVCTLALVALLFDLTKQSEHERVQLEFRNRATIMAGSLQRDLDRYLEAVQSLGGYFAGSHVVSRDQFRAFVRGALERHPGVLAMSWNPRFSPTERAAYRAAARRDGLAGFEITERDANGELRRAGERNEYISVFYIEPVTGNEKALGFDVGANPKRRQALDLARDTGSPVATGRLRLVQTRQEQAGILLFSPVYRGAAAIDTLEQRRALLNGYAVGVFRVGDMIAASVRDLAATNAIDVYLHDESAPQAESLLAAFDRGQPLNPFAMPLPPGTNVNGRTGAEHAFRFAGRDWRLTFVPTAEYLVAQQSHAPWLVLAAGLLVTALLNLFQLLLTARQVALADSNIRLQREATERQQAQEQQQESEARYRALVEHAPEAIVVLDADLGTFVDFNHHAAELFGCDRDTLLHLDPWALSPPHQSNGEASADAAMRHIQEALNGGLPQFEWTHRDVQGRDIPCEVRLVRLPAAGRRLVRGSIIDITARKLAEKALFKEKEKALVTLHSIGEAVIVTDQAGSIDYMNRVAESMTGWSTQEAQDTPLQGVLTLLDYATHQPSLDVGALHDAEAFGANRGSRALLRSHHGHEYAVQVSIAPILGQDGEVLGSVLAISDISELRELTEELAHRAAHDALTGLVNRHEFERRLAAALNAVRQRGTPYTLGYLDLDQFKVVNDTVGHGAGDELLKQVTGILMSKIRSRDTLGRIGGDEFCILFEDCTLDDAQRVAQSLIDVLGEFRFAWQGHSFDIGVSIGMLPITPETADISQLMARADMACYAAKEQGRNQVCAYREGDPDLNQRQSEMFRAAGLKDAVSEGRFRLYAQPIVPLREGSKGPVFYELLLRMLDADGSLLRPAQFIPAAERYGMMGSIDRWVIETAFHHCQAGVGGSRTAGITINLSGNSLNEKTLLDFVLRQRDASGIAPERVCFEITETAAINHLQHAVDFIHGLQRHGFRFALDDFGSGLSSFNYLKRFAVDFVKIDGGFVQRMVEEPTDRAVVESISQICHSLGIRTIAERAETQATIDALKSIGVDYVQGYAIAREAPLETAAVHANTA